LKIGFWVKNNKGPYFSRHHSSRILGCANDASFFYILGVDNALRLGLAGLHASRCFIGPGLPGPTTPRLIPFLFFFLLIFLISSFFKNNVLFVCIFSNKFWVYVLIIL
jgi:hypothetical protein